MHTPIDLTQLAHELGDPLLNDLDRVHLAASVRPRLGDVAPACPDWCSNFYDRQGRGCWGIALAALDLGGIFHLQAVHRSRPDRNGTSAVEMVTVWRPGDPSETVLRRSVQVGGARGDEDGLDETAARLAAEELLAAAALLEELGGVVDVPNPYDPSER